MNTPPRPDWADWPETEHRCFRDDHALLRMPGGNLFCPVCRLMTNEVLPPSEAEELFAEAVADAEALIPESKRGGGGRSGKRRKKPLPKRAGRPYVSEDEVERTLRRMRKRRASS